MSSTAWRAAFCRALRRLEAMLLVADEKQTLLISGTGDVVEPEEDGTWRLVGIFGDQKTVKGRIKGMNLVNHKILFEPQTE